MRIIILLLCTIIGLTLIKRNSLVGIGIASFCIFELIFRSFGILRFIIDSSHAAVIFLISTTILCIASKSLLYIIGEKKQ